MILDASVAIALRSPQDAHAAHAERLVVEADELIIHPVALAECLVAPARAGLLAETHRVLLDDLGIRLWHPDEDEPDRIATLRAESRVALPDCYPLTLAERTGYPLATFDAALRRAARDRGVPVNT